MRFLFAGLVLCCASASAQTPDTLTGTFGPDGLSFRTADASVSLGALVQADARFFASEADLGTDQFLLRRARFFVRGRVGPVAFRVVPDFGQGRVELDEAWGEVPLGGPLAGRAGFFKPPVGLERLRSSSALPFLERALPTALVPDTDLGAMLRADLWSRGEVALAVLNGVPDGQTGQGDAGDGKDVALRVFGAPFGGLLEGLSLGIGVSYGQESGTPAAPALARYRSSAGRQFAAYISGDSAAIAAGARARFVPQASLELGPFSGMAEWALSSQRVARGPAERTLAAHAWQLAATLVLTGEDATTGRLRPARPLGEGGIGAVEVAARVHRLALDDEAFPLFMDPSSSARTAMAVTLGVNWYLSYFARVGLNAERTGFGAVEGLDDPPAENALLGRLQVSI